MNFEHMPELGWAHGYALALFLMVLTCVVLYPCSSDATGCEQPRAPTPTPGFTSVQVTSLSGACRPGRARRWASRSKGTLYGVSVHQVRPS